MLKLPRYRELTFDQREYVDALRKLKASYYTLPQEKIDEVNRLAPSISLNKPQHGLNFDNSQYLESISKLKKGYYTLPSEIINRIIALAKTI